MASGVSGNQSLPSIIRCDAIQLNEEIICCLNARRLNKGLDMGFMSNILADRAISHVERIPVLLDSNDTEKAIECLLLAKRAVRALKTECR